MSKWLLICILIPLSLSAQVSEKVVRDFSGGMVNSLANALMQDNQATILENYTIDPFGNIQRRAGLSYHINDGDEITALFPMYPKNSKQMLTLQKVAGHYESDSADLLVLTVCNQDSCSEIIMDGFYNPRRSAAQYFSVSAGLSNNQLALSARKSEMVLWDGVDAFNARPYGPGQPKVFAMDGGGTLSETNRYKYAYVDTSANDTSRFSAPSWSVTTLNGKVYIEFETPPDTTTQDKRLIYRKHQDSTNYRYVAAMTTDVNYFIDTFTTLGDTANYDWTPGGSLSATNYTFLNATFPPRSPGGFSLDTVFVSGNQSILQEIGENDMLRFAASYILIYVDSAGRESYGSAPITLSTTMDAADTSIAVYITNIPVPEDTAKFSHKYFKRKMGSRCTVGDPGDAFGDLPASYGTHIETRWFTLPDIAISATSYTDTTAITDLDTTNYTFCYSVLDYAPESLCPDDSLIPFTPDMAIFHGDRLFAIGNQQFKDRLYYSDFGRPTTFVPASWYHRIPTNGDWPVALLSLTNDRLAIFQQNSIYLLAGLSFFQSSKDALVEGIGLTGRQSLAMSKNRAFFAHTTGIYAMSRGGGVTSDPLSLTVQKSYDSLAVDSAVGRIVDGEYWFSASDASTLIFSQIPSPHWKAYSFGLQDAILYDSSSTSVDFSSDRWVIALTNDSLYEYGYQSVDSDGVTPFYARYRSKAHFEGLDREKVFYIDFEGEGTLDSLEVTLLDGADTVLVDTCLIDFSDKDRDRLPVRKIVSELTVQWRDFGYGDYTISGYVIGYLPWDKGRSL